MENKNKKNLKLIIWAVFGLALFFIITIPWRGYVYRKNIAEGKQLLGEHNYTGAYVKFQKAEMIELNDSKAEDLKNLTKNAAKDVISLKSFLTENNFKDFANALDQADSKICNLGIDRELIEKGVSDIAKVNLTFCAQSGPKSYDSWILLGIANLRLSESSSIFKELKPGFRQEAAAAFAKAYEVDPINKTAIKYSIEINKSLVNQPEVDRWQKLLDNLERIEK